VIFCASTHAGFGHVKVGPAHALASWNDWTYWLQPVQRHVILLMWTLQLLGGPGILAIQADRHCSRVSALFILFHPSSSSSFAITSIFEILTLFHIHHHSVFSLPFSLHIFSLSAFIFSFWFGLLLQ
jgi:hypothetical protein